MDEMLFANALERLRRNLLELKVELAGVRVALAFQRAEREAKFNPNWTNQPRVPAGNQDGGQWSGGGGGSGGGAPHTPAPRGGRRHAPPAPQPPRAGSGPTPPPSPPAPQSFADQAIRAAAQTSAPLMHWSAERIGDAQARITDWADKNIPGGLDAALQVSDFAARTLANLGGPEALRKYDELSDLMARGGDAAADAYHREITAAVSRGTMTRQQADDASVLVSTTATLGMVLPVGKLGKVARPAERALGRATLGRAKSLQYRETFFRAHPELRGKVVIHHAVEQRVLKQYPGLISAHELHSLENLRGIPADKNAILHLSKIRKEWNEFYKSHPFPKRRDLLNKASEIDAKYGHLFAPPMEMSK